MNNFEKITKDRRSLSEFLALITDGCHKCPANNKCGKYGKRCQEAFEEWFKEINK